MVMADGGKNPNLFAQFNFPADIQYQCHADAVPNSPTVSLISMHVTVCSRSFDRKEYVYATDWPKLKPKLDQIVYEI